MQGYVLHARPYRESSALVELFSPAGRQRAVVRGARSRTGSLARPFVPLAFELRGRSELKTLGSLETAAPPHLLSGDRLFSGLYLNELLVRLLAVEDAQPGLYELYAATLMALAEDRPLQPLLRAFEWRLLGELGYGFSLQHDSLGRPIARDAIYCFAPEQGMVRVEQFVPGALYGHQLQALAVADWQQPGVLGAAKRLMRQALEPHLAGKPLVSRQLFARARASVS